MFTVSLKFTPVIRFSWLKMLSLVSMKLFYYSIKRIRMKKGFIVIWLNIKSSTIESNGFNCKWSKKWKFDYAIKRVFIFELFYPKCILIFITTVDKIKAHQVLKIFYLNSLNEINIKKALKKIKEMWLITNLHITTNLIYVRNLQTTLEHKYNKIKIKTDLI